MAMSLPGVLDKLKTPEGQKLFRYSVASVVAVLVSVVCLAFFSGILDLRAWLSSVLATAVATVPNYQMNRRWAWGRSGKSHLWREVMPFWTLAAIGLGFSTLCVDLMEAYAKSHHYSHLVRTGTYEIVYIGAFGILWVAKFIIFNKVLFAHHPEDLPEALDGRTGIPL